jgi:hypothetical protein
MVIKTAMDLAKTNPWTLIKNFRVGIQKTARELAFTPCLELDGPPKKQETSERRCCLPNLRGDDPDSLMNIIASYGAAIADILFWRWRVFDPGWRDSLTHPDTLRTAVLRGITQPAYGSVKISVVGLNLISKNSLDV